MQKIKKREILKDIKVYIVLIYFVYLACRGIYNEHLIYILHILICIGLIFKSNWARRIGIVFLIINSLVTINIFYPLMPAPENEIVMLNQKENFRLLTLIAYEFLFLLGIWFLKTPFSKENENTDV